MNARALELRTPEGIAFALPLAGPVTRMLAWGADVLVVGVTSSAVAGGLSVFALVSPDLAQALAFLAFFAGQTGYGFLFEWFWRGQTPGKRMLGLRVVDAAGLRLRFHQVVLRNLLRFVDVLPAAYLVGGAACLLSRHAQRLGDLAAGTVVVRAGRPPRPDLAQVLPGRFNSLRAHPHLVARLRQRVAPAVADAALDAVLRRDALADDARVAVFARLAAHLRAVVEFPAETLEGLPAEQQVRAYVDVLFRPADRPPSGEADAATLRG